MRSPNRLLVCAFVVILSLALLPVLAFSADDEGDAVTFTLPDRVNYTSSDGTKIFWMGPRDPTRSDLEVPPSPTGTRAYTLEATGTYCKIYVDSGCSPYPSGTTITAVVNQWDTLIYPTDTALFGTPPYSKIEVRIREIDGAWGIGGYFTGSDPDAVYIDNDDLSSWGYEIMAHELQHLIHNSKDWNEDLWVNEGCADMAIHFCFGPTVGSLQSHLGSFESNPNNDLFQFDNAGYDYGSSYAFVLYFWDHYGGNASVTSLVADSSNGKTGFNDILTSKGYSDQFDDVYEKWIVANWLDDTSIYNGSYGYSDQDVGVSTGGTHSSYPVSTQSGTVQRYGATYRMFMPGTGDTLRLTTGGNAIYEIILLGQNGNANDTYMLGGAGTYDVTNVGLNYSAAVLVIGATADESFSYSAEFLDLVPPSTLAVVDPVVPNGKNGWYITKPQVNFVCNDPDATVYYRLNGDTWLNYTGGFLQIEEGTHELEYFAEDKAFNQEAVKNVTFNVDFTPPVTNLTLDPESPDGDGGYYITQPTATIAAGPMDLLFYRMDGGPNQTYTGPLMVPEGEHTIEYWSEDLAGNFDIVKSVSVKVDITPPEILHTIAPEDPDGQNGYYKAWPEVSLDFDSANGTEGYYSVDSGPVIEYSSPITLEDGNHWFEFWARDPAGNTADVANLSIKVDTVAPKTKLATLPKDPSSGDWFNVTPIVNLTTDPDADIWYSMDGSSFTRYLPNSQNDNGTFFGILLEETGVQILSVYSQDRAGNREATKNYTFRIDTAPPEVEIHFNVQPRETGWFTSEPLASFTTPEKNITIYYEMNGEVYQYRNEFKVLEGITNITYWGIDQAGNQAPKLVYNARVDTTPPDARLWMVSDVLIDEFVTADAGNSTDTVSGIAKYRFVWGDGEGTDWQDSSVLTHIYREAGIYNVSMVAKDHAGLESDPAQVMIFVTVPADDDVVDDDAVDDDVVDDDVDDDADDDDDTGTSTASSGLGFWLILIIILTVVLLVIVIILVVVFVSRKRSRDEDDDDEEDYYDDDRGDDRRRDAWDDDDDWDNEEDDFEISDSVVSSRDSRRASDDGWDDDYDDDWDDDDDYDDDFDDDWDEPPRRGRKPVSSRPPDRYVPPPPPPPRSKRGPVRGKPVPPPPEDDWDDDDDGPDWEDVWDDGPDNEDGIDWE